MGVCVGGRRLIKKRVERVRCVCVWMVEDVEYKEMRCEGGEYGWVCGGLVEGEENRESEMCVCGWLRMWSIKK